MTRSTKRRQTLSGVGRCFRLRSFGFRHAGIATIAAAVMMSGGCGFLPGANEADAERQDSGGKNEDTASASSGSNAVMGVENVRDAVVYIEARGGVFDDLREFGTDNLAGSGSGFIVDGDEELVVTNNHVVTGASYLEVYLDGEDEPVDARVLGASECSDLALLKLEESDLPYLEWHEDPIEAGMDVRAAGYPGGDVAPGERPDYTITSGTVTTTEASGETQWASVDSVVEHDALLRGGNSGGPLVDETGNVVGINYAGIEESSQSFAIDRQQAEDLIGQLEEGDTEGIGINGEAYIEEESSYSSIDVYSTKTGSPAAEVGIENPTVDPETGELSDFDSIVEIEGSRLGEKGTMEEYCNIIRQHDPEDPLSITVERYRGGAYESTLEGTLNGGEEGRLEVVETAEATEAPEESQSSEVADSGGYTDITNDANNLAMQVPSGWTDVRSAAWSFEDQDIGVSLAAAPDVDAYNDTWNSPGVFLAASNTLSQDYTVDSLLDYFDQSGSCDYDARYDYPSDGAFTGKFDMWTSCGGTGSSFFTLVATPDNSSETLVLVQMAITSDSDLDALDKVKASFNLTGQVQ